MGSVSVLTGSWCLVSNFLFNAGPDLMGVRLLNATVPRTNMTLLNYQQAVLLHHTVQLKNQYENVQPVAIHKRLAL